MSDGFVVIDKFICQIKAQYMVQGEIILNSSDLNADNISRILAIVIPPTILSSSKVEGLCVLNLGNIPADQFAILFPQRLVQAFADYFSGFSEEAIRCNRLLLQEPNVRSEPTQLLAELDNNPAVLYPLAICCLQPPALQQLLQSRQPDRLQRLLKLMLNSVGERQSTLPTSFYNRVSASRLAAAALYYLLNVPQGEEWLSHHTPPPDQLNRWGEAIVSGEIAPDLVVQLIEKLSFLPRLNIVARRWLLPLWQNKAVRDVVIKHAGRAAAGDIVAALSVLLPQPENPSQQSQQLHQPPPLQRVTNAGLLLLWPLLPQLFSLLELTEENVFTRDTARWQAALSLDWLSWAEDQPVAERLRVNCLLCGIPEDMPLPEQLSLSPEQQQLIDTWLTAVCQQLPGGQKLSINDLRALFLQRPGEINHQTLPPQIFVQPEAFDYLLRDWPWPLTLASFPWLEQPLTVVWPVNGLTG